jgi:hypothetical protein
MGPQLFDSTEWGDHLTAREWCATCPAVQPCLQTALDIAASSPLRGEHRSPDGTWAGLLFVNGSIAVNAGQASNRARKRAAA